METTLGQALAAFVSAGLGAVLATSIGVSHRQLCALISFAAGALLATTVFHILPDTWAHLSPFPILIALLSGYFLFHVINRYVFHVCPACAASHFEKEVEAHRFRSIAVLLGIALTIHSLMDGIAIALGEELGSTAGHSIFFTIAIHKLPEGLALCALLMKAGQNKTKALLATLAFETSTLLGWWVGSFFLKHWVNEQWLNLALLHIGGGFIFLALHATLNEARNHSPRFILTFFLLGFLFMGLVR